MATRITPDPDTAPRALRCWLRHRCPFGCLHASDCVLLDPLPVHDHDYPCPGMFGPDGRWMRHCREEKVA
jgi:hypothetical protein